MYIISLLIINYKTCIFDAYRDLTNRAGDDIIFPKDGLSFPEKKK